MIYLDIVTVSIICMVDSRQSVWRELGKETENYIYQRQQKQMMCVERNRRRTFKQHHLLDTHITKYYAASGLYLSGWCILYTGGVCTQCNIRLNGRVCEVIG